MVNVCIYGLLELLLNSQNCESKSANAKHLQYFAFSLGWEAGICLAW